MSDAIARGGGEEGAMRLTLFLDIPYLKYKLYLPTYVNTVIACCLDVCFVSI